MKHFSEISPAAERVVDAAETLIQRQGYNGFSYDDISRQIGIKKPSIHHHFATKSDLVRVVVQRYVHRFVMALDAIETDHANAVARLSAYAELFSQAYQADQRLCVCGMLGAEAATLSEEVAEEVKSFFDANIKWLTKIISQGVQAGSLKSLANVQAHAYALLSVLEGAMLVGRGTRTNQSPALVAHTYLSNLLP